MSVNDNPGRTYSSRNRPMPSGQTPFNPMASSPCDRAVREVKPRPRSAQRDQDALLVQGAEPLGHRR